MTISFKIITSFISNAPLETAVCCAFTLLSSPMFLSEWGFRLILYFPFFFALCFVCNELFTGEKRSLYYSWGLTGILALSIPALLLNILPSLASYKVSIIIAAVSMLLCLRNAEDNRHIAARSAAPISAVILTIIVFIAMQLVLAMFGIFPFGKYPVLWMYVTPLYIFLVAPLTLCALHHMYKQRNISATNHLAKILSHFLVSPALIIFNFILYIYVIFMTQLPQDVVTHPIIWFYAFAITGHLLHTSSPSRTFHWYYKNFWIISLPMLVLFWWGLIKRVSSYSLTEDSIYLIATGIVFTLSTIILALKRHNSLRLIMWSTVVCLGAITFVPGITAKKLAEIVQTQRLERLMDELGVRDENGHFAPYDNKKVQGNEDKIYELREAYYYLEQSIGYQEMDEKYQPTHEKNILNYDTYPYNRYGYDSEEYIPY